MFQNMLQEKNQKSNGKKKRLHQLPKVKVRTVFPSLSGVLTATHSIFSTTVNLAKIRSKVKNWMQLTIIRLEYELNVARSAEI